MRVMLFVSVLFWSMFTNAQINLDNASSKQMVMTNLSSMPLAFTENQGQFGGKALFRASAGGATFYFYDNEVAYLFVRNTDELIEDDAFGQSNIPGMPDELYWPRYKKESMLIKAQFVAANPNPEVVGGDLLPHKSNYFYGNDISKRRTNVNNYSSIIYKDIYPGIDLKYYGSGSSMKYDFIINPGSDLSQIGISYQGATDISISNTGELLLNTDFGIIRENKPYVYQVIGGSEVERDAIFYIKEPGIIGFEINDWDPAYPIVIDPELVFSSYLGGNNREKGYDIAVDEGGCVYITGETRSPSSFPVENPFDSLFNGGTIDAFVTKFSADGNELVYSTYIGGSDEDIAYGIAVDNLGSAYITGKTQSTDFPLVNPIDSTLIGTNHQDAFITKLSPDGSSLIYSTFLGEQSSQTGRSIAVDSEGCACVTGYTGHYFTIFNAYDSTWNGSNDVFVAKFSADGTNLIYSTFLGGESLDNAYGIAIDSYNNVYITGYTNSIDFPTENAYQTDQPGLDIFVSKLSADGQTLIYSTYIGGSEGESGGDIAVNLLGNAYITGYTNSANFPTVNPYDAILDGASDAFITKMSVDGSALLYSTYLGGTGHDNGSSIGINGAGSAYVTGTTYSLDFPIENPYQMDQEDRDAFVTQLSPDGSSLIYSTYLGGNSRDEGSGIAVDIDGFAYVTGYTGSITFPIFNIFGPFQPSIGNRYYSDAFVAKFGPAGWPMEGTVSGVVTDAITLNPVSGVVVSIFGLDAQDTTDIFGYYNIDSIYTGYYDLMFSHYDYRDSLIIDNIVSGDDTTIINVEFNDRLKSLWRVDDDGIIGDSCDFFEIQACIDASSNGDTILVYPVIAGLKLYQVAVENCTTLV